MSNIFDAILGNNLPTSNPENVTAVTETIADVPASTVSAFTIKSTFDPNRDPRPDLDKDSRRWERLLRLAGHQDRQLAANLHGLRAGGARLVGASGNGIIRPGEWDEDEDEYDRIRQIYLVPFRTQIMQLLKRI